MTDGSKPERRPRTPTSEQFAGNPEPGLPLTPKQSLFKHLRTKTPLYTTAEAARIVNVPASTLYGWCRKQLVTRLPAGHRMEPTIPFVGLAEAFVLAAFRDTGTPMRTVIPAVEHINSRLGWPHVLASRRLRIEGPPAVAEYARQQPGIRGRAAAGLVAESHGRQAFAEPVASRLRMMVYAPLNSSGSSRGYAILIRLPDYDGKIVVNPHHNCGRPTFVRGHCRLDTVLELVHAGETAQTVSRVYDLPVEDIENALKVEAARVG